MKNENPELTHGWKTQTSAAKKQINAQTISEVDDNRIVDQNNSEDDNTRGQEHQAAVDLDLNEGDWVAVLYDKKWHAGQIKGIDSDNELEVKSLRQWRGIAENRPVFKWPTPDDILDVDVKDVVCKLAEQVAVGRSGRSFKLAPGDFEKNEKNYKK